MNNIENCLQNKIANSNNKLQPTIFKAILHLYKKGSLQISARMVKEVCKEIDGNIDWNQRIPAICSSMERAIECGFKIISKSKHNNDFTIVFDGYDINYDTPTTKIKATKVSNHIKISDNSIDNSIDNKIEKIIKSLDWQKLKDNKIPKLLIIGCCDAKSYQPNNLANIDHNNFDFGNNINTLRKSRIEFYKSLPDDYFTYPEKKRNKEIVEKSYFVDCLNENYRREALEVYGSNGSPFYKPEMKLLYRDKIKNCNLHLLIISGLYGIIKHNDYINDYHLEIKKGKNGFWGNEIYMATQEYIRKNKIDDNHVLYSLSNEYKYHVNPIISKWKNIWIEGSRTQNLNNSAKCVSILLNKLS